MVCGVCVCCVRYVWCVVSVMSVCEVDEASAFSFYRAVVGIRLERLNGRKEDAPAGPHVSLGFCRW